MRIHLASTIRKSVNSMDIVCDSCYEVIDTLDTYVYGVFEVINFGTSDEVHVLQRVYVDEYDAKHYANTDYLIVKKLPIY